MILQKKCLAAFALLTCLCCFQNVVAQPDQKLTHDIFKELIEINTTNSVGNTTKGAEADRKSVV